MLNVGEGARRIVALRRSIERALLREGIAVHFDNRPHMTLAYGPQPTTWSRIDPIAWMVDELRLVGSLQGKGRHIDHGRVPLTSRQGSLF